MRCLVIALSILLSVAWPALAQNNSGGGFSASGGSSGSSPGGTSGMLQYNNTGTFGGVSGWTSDGTNLIGGFTNTINGVSLNSSQTSNQLFIDGGGNSSATGQSLFAIGPGAGTSLSSTFPIANQPQQNLLIGIDAGHLLTCGRETTIVGHHAGENATTSTGCAPGNVDDIILTALGSFAAQSVTTGFGITAIGQKSLAGDSVGSNDTAVGTHSATSYQGNHSVFVGAGAGDNSVNAGDQVVVVGASAGSNIGTGFTNNVYVGYTAGSNGQTNTSSDMVVVGAGAGNAITSSSQSVVIGSQAAASVTNGNGIFIGYQAGRVVTTNTLNTIIGNSSAANLTGCCNLIVGSSAAGPETTIAHAAIFGGDGPNFAYNDVYFGKGAHSTAAVAYTIHGTGGSGTDSAAGALNLAGGASTGAGTCAPINLQVAPARTTGSTDNPLATVATVDCNKHISYTGAAPSVSAGGGCGGSPAIDANATDIAGQVTVGSATTSCVITFNKAYVTYVHCRVTSGSTLAAFAYAYTKTAITVSATVLGGDLIDYNCDGA